MNDCNCCGQKNCNCNYPDPRILLLENTLAIAREGLEAIKKHIELIVPTGWKMSVTWTIVDKTLSRMKEERRE